MELSKLDTMLESRESRPDQLIEVLQDMQAEYEYLPKEGLCIVSERLNVPLIEVYRVASFYKAFTLMPHGRHSLTLCQGTSCHVRGSQMLLDTVRGQLDILPGQTTKDGAFTLKTVNCLGCCALGPVVVLDDVYHDRMTPRKLRRLIEAARRRG
jgi:NADH:ubiquinone oxidoreductase subunit E